MVAALRIALSEVTMLASHTSAHSLLFEMLMVAPDTDLRWLLSVRATHNAFTDPNLILLITRPPLPMRPPICAVERVRVLGTG